MLMTLLWVLLTAILSSVLTVLAVRWWFLRYAQAHWNNQVDALHESLMRTVEIRVKRAMIESLAETRQDEVLRDSTWRAARTGGELLNDSMRAWLKRRQSSDTDRR